jgi:molybdopterin-guanine dinucleotide biosynthesis protein A
MRVGGIVLCGGRSSRMGVPKAWLPFAGELLLPRVLRIVGDVVQPLIAVAAQGQDLPPLPATVEVVCDEVEGMGPLQGLATGLAALHGRADVAYLSACDVPFLMPAFIRRMIGLTGDAAICVPFAGGHHHPLAAVYRIDVLPVARELSAASRGPNFLLESVPTRVVAANELTDVDPILRSLRNLNTPADYEAALREQAEL